MRARAISSAEGREQTAVDCFLHCPSLANQAAPVEDHQPFKALAGWFIQKLVLLQPKKLRQVCLLGWIEDRITFSKDLLVAQ